MWLHIGISWTNVKTYLLQLLIPIDKYVCIIYNICKIEDLTHMSKKSDVFCIHYKNQFIIFILLGTFQIFMARLPVQCPFCLPAEVCFANSLIAALLCRVEYNPFLLFIPSLHLFLSLLVCLSVPAPSSCSVAPPGPVECHVSLIKSSL